MFLSFYIVSYNVTSSYLFYVSISLICDNSATTQNLACLSYWYRTKRLQMHSLNKYSFVTQFAKLAAGEQLCRRCTHRKYSTLERLKVSPEKSHILSCDTVVANERYVLYYCLITNLVYYLIFYLTNFTSSGFCVPTDL
jgi:hypothetical protein